MSDIVRKHFADFVTLQRSTVENRVVFVEVKYVF